MSLNKLKVMLRVEKNLLIIKLSLLGFCTCSGQDHTVTLRMVVATQQLGSLLQILAFMASGLITMMAHTHLTVILATLFSNLRYFILDPLNLFCLIL